MGNLHTVYLTAHGEFTNAAWLGEYAQMGIRLALEDEAALPAKGSLFTIRADHGAVVADSGTQAGTNGTLVRTWSARLGGVGSSENADAAWQADLCDDMYTFLNTIKAEQHNAFRWTHCKIAPVQADGKYGAPAATYTFTSAIVGSGVSSHLPPEVSIAMSLRAGVLGRRGRGRMYLPACSLNRMDSATGLVGAAGITAMGNALQTLVTNLENAPGTELITPLVVVTSAGSAIAARPSQVRIGNHYDVQRRRQAQVKETYSALSL